MNKHGKRYQASLKTFDRHEQYSYQEAVKLVKQNATAKFDESFEISMNLGVDPRKADQLVRGTGFSSKRNRQERKSFGFN